VLTLAGFVLDCAERNVEQMNHLVVQARVPPATGPPPTPVCARDPAATDPYQRPYCKCDF